MLKRLVSHTRAHRNEIAKELNSMVSFLLHKLKYRWPQVEWGLRMKSFSHIVLLISTSRIQLVLHPHCFPPRLQSLRLAINWWQSRSPRSSSGPGSLRPVFWSTHQHFPRWPSRAGWHCKHKDKGVILVLQQFFWTNCEAEETYSSNLWRCPRLVNYCFVLTAWSFKENLFC